MNNQNNVKVNKTYVKPVITLEALQITDVITTSTAKTSTKWYMGDTKSNGASVSISSLLGK